MTEGTQEVSRAVYAGAEVLTCRGSGADTLNLLMLSRHDTTHSTQTWPSWLPPPSLETQMRSRPTLGLDARPRGFEYVSREVRRQFIEEHAGPYLSLSAATANARLDEH